MTIRRKLWLCAALAATPLSLAAGWCWNRSCDSEYVSSARVSVPSSLVARLSNPPSALNVEEAFLSPEVVAAAADLLQERGVPLPVESRFDSEIDYLLARLDARHAQNGDRIDVELRYRTPDAEQAVAVLTAVVDAGIRALQSLAPEVADAGENERNRERARLAQALEQQQHHVAELQEQSAGGGREPFDAAKSAEALHALEISSEGARARRVEAEDQLALACRDVRAGIPTEQIAARLPQGPEWSATRDIVGKSLLIDELQHLESEIETAAALYGRNHPRMVGLRLQLDQARQKTATQTEISPKGLVVPTSTEDAATHPQDTIQSAGEMLLAAMEEKVRQASAVEQQLDQRLASAKAARDERQALEPQLAEARRDLEFLQKEHERVRREVTAAQHHAEERCVSVSDPPLLSPVAAAPSPTKPLLSAGIIGLIATAGLLYRSQRSPAGHTPSATIQRQAPISERYRSQQEDNLARLRRLKPVA